MGDEHQGAGSRGAAVGHARGGAECGCAVADRRQCPPRDGQAIQITAGDIDCVTAADYAAQYDLNVDKYQEIGPFTCYSGNAMTAPLLFTCVANTEDHAEFAVYPA